MHLGVFERFPREPDIAETIFDQEILYGHTFSFDCLRDFLSLPAKAKRIVEALRGCDSKRWALSNAEAPYRVAGSHTASV
jgi:hypothetical protein